MYIYESHSAYAHWYITKKKCNKSPYHNILHIKKLGKAKHVKQKINMYMYVCHISIMRRRRQQQYDEDDEKRASAAAAPTQ